MITNHLRQWLLVWLLIVSTAYPLATLAEESSQANIHKLFYTDEARQLIHHFEGIDDKEAFITQIRNLSIHLRYQLNDKNRSKLLLHVMRVINSFHDEKPEYRFAILQKLTENQLYDLIFLWRQALYTSSFTGVFELLQIKLTDAKTLESFHEKLVESNYEGLNLVIQVAASFNHLERFLDLFSSQQIRPAMERYARRMSQTQNFFYAMSWVEVMLTTHDAALLEDMFIFLQDRVEGKPIFNLPKYEHNYLTKKYSDRELYFEKLSDQKNLSEEEFYGLTMGAYFRFLDSATVQPKQAFITYMQNWLKDNPQFQTPRFENLDIAVLQSTPTTSVQRHYYFDDNDGWATWVEFLRKHKRLGDQVRRYDDYAHITRASKKGNAIAIYANAPRQFIPGQIQLQKAIDNHHNTERIFVHRGHSYHLHRSVARTRPTTRLAILGSCGAYNDLHAVLKRLPKAQVIFSKGKGTYWVNRAVLDVINEHIVTGQDINWRQLRGEILRKLYNTHQIKDRHQEIIDIFEQYYVLPHENIGLSMLRHAVGILNNP